MNKVIFGITGVMGSGKSTLAQNLKAQWPNDLHIIEVDDIRRYILWQSKEPLHVSLRKSLSIVFNVKSNSEYEWIDRAELTSIIFESAQNLSKYSSVATPVIKNAITKEIKKCLTDCVIVWSELIEENYESLMRHSNVIMIKANSESIINRLDKQDDVLSKEQKEKRLKILTTQEEKYNLIVNRNIKHITVNSENIDYKNIIDEIKNIYKEDLSFCKFRIPKAVGRVIWEVTNECNYGCKYCIFASTGRKPEGELETSKMLNTVLELKNSNFNHIKFTGGEPFLRDDMVEILEKACSLGMRCDISTNASKITPEIAQKLANIPLEMIHVSLDGHDLQTHEFVRGKKSFEPTLRGLKILSNYGLKIRVGCVIHEKNQYKIKEMVQLCDELNVSEVIFSLMEPVGRLKNKTTGLSNRDIKDLKNELNILKNQYKSIKVSYNLPEHTIQLISKDEIKSHVNACPGGKDFIFINSIGLVSPCTWVSEHRPDFIGGSLHLNSLEEILNSKKINDYKEITQKIAQLGRAICPMDNLSETKKIEQALLASSIKKEEGFSKYAKIYAFTTENLAYFNDLDLNQKSILTVGGSFDQAILAAQKGARSIENIDINLCAKYYAELKYIGMLNFNYNDFLTFFLRNINALNIKQYEKLKPMLSFETITFFDKLYAIFNHKGDLLRESDLFNNKHDISYLKIKNSIYLKDEKSYKLSQETISKTNFVWHSLDIKDIKSLKNNFDIIFLSNISDYSHKIFPHQQHVQSFRDEIVIPALSKLNSNGICMFGYVFDDDDNFKSIARNHFNDEKIRHLYYNNISKFSYTQIKIESAMQGTPWDKACLLTKEKSHD